MKNTPNTYISLFSCAGVGCYGFQRAGFTCVATNELIESRMKIQRFNNKCEREEGYIVGDITLKGVKDQIYDEIQWWKTNKGIKEIDVIVATPPCQGMSIFNHKKNENDIERNSLVIESLKIVKDIQPKFFVFENVPSFMDTECIITENERRSIKEAHDIILGGDFVYYYDTINFKYYGSKSSRTRTLVIGVRKDLIQFIAPMELFPDRTQETTLRDTIGDLPSLQTMGEISKNDIYHSFRPYPDYMREWISNLKEGQSAFENEDENKRPYKINENGIKIKNVNKTGDKYKRQAWDKCAMSVHTRNDQLASQNTIHPSDDRVFSIRELMRMMSIPDDFKWTDQQIDTINNLSLKEKEEFLKKNELNIRRCIGEAVPTSIFYQIANKVSLFLNVKHYSDRNIRKIIKNNSLDVTENLIDFIRNKGVTTSGERELSNATLSRIAELANNSRVENAAYYTGKDTLNEIFKYLPYFDKKSIRILEPAVGTGNFIPFLIKKYSYADKVIIDVLDTDSYALDVLMCLNEKLPSNVQINVLNDDFITHDFNDIKYDLVIGNPPYLKLTNSCPKLKKYRCLTGANSANNLAAFFLKKSADLANYVSFIMPKNMLYSLEYKNIRKDISKRGIKSIIDFGENGFRGIDIETILLTFNSNGKPGNVIIKSLPKNISIIQKQSYITDSLLPNWVLFRNRLFDEVLCKKEFDVFEVYRDREITKKNTLKRGNIWVIRSQNINREGTAIEHIPGYDLFISIKELRELGVYKYFMRDDIYLAPNMTYYPRMVRKPNNSIVNGSVAILIPKTDQIITDKDIEYIASNEFEQFYRIARNYATRSLNIDNTSVYYFCIDKKK